MSLAALPELLLAWVRTQGAALLRGDKAAMPQDPFRPGQQYEGRVVDQLANGRHLVRIAGHNLDMNLPRNLQAGDSVRLTYLNAAPRPTFLLNTTPVTAAQQVRISETAQQVNALLRMAATPASAGSAATPAAPAGSVSTGTSGATSTGMPAATSPVPGSPLTGSAGGMTAAASALSPRLGASTVTVTSAGAAGGATPAPAQASQARATAVLNPLGAAMTQTAALARPIVVNVDMLRGYSAAFRLTPAPVASATTGLVGQAVDGARATLGSGAGLKPTTLAELPSPSSHMLPVRLAQTVRESGLFYEAHLARWHRGVMSLEAIRREPQARLARVEAPAARIPELGNMPEEAAKLAGRQLQLLEGAPFQWQGPVWPGQWLDWRVSERTDADGSDTDADGDGPHWHTELRLALPGLGEVHALLGLRGEQVSVSLRAMRDSTRDSLRAALPELIAGLGAAGLSVRDARVESSHADA